MDVVEEDTSASLAVLNLAVCLDRDTRARREVEGDIDEIVTAVDVAEEDVTVRLAVVNLAVCLDRETRGRREAEGDNDDIVTPIFVAADVFNFVPGVGTENRYCGMMRNWTILCI